MNNKLFSIFTTKKQLRKQIEELSYLLQIEQGKTRTSAIIDRTGLPPCKSLACYACKHATFRRREDGIYSLLGCGKGRSCEDYSPAAPRPDPATAVALLKYALGLKGGDIEI